MLRSGRWGFREAVPATSEDSGRASCPHPHPPLSANAVHPACALEQAEPQETCALPLKLRSADLLYLAILQAAGSNHDTIPDDDQVTNSAGANNTLSIALIGTDEQHRTAVAKALSGHWGTLQSTWE